MSELRDCTCLGTCRGAEGLSANWRCTKTGEQGRIDDDARGQRERAGSPVSEANAVAGEVRATGEHDPTTDVAAYVCKACDGDGDLIDALGDGEHVTCLGCGHCWAPNGHDVSPVLDRGLTGPRASAAEVGCTACSADPPPQPNDWPDECEMRLWRAEVDGATYWIAAESMRDALQALASCLGDEGMTTELEPCEVSIEHQSVAKAWKAIVTNEDPPGRVRMFHAVVAHAEKSAEGLVLACSEWP